MTGVSWITVATAVLVLVAIAPWVGWVRHPQQRPFSAYLLFVSAFAVIAVGLFLLLGALVSELGVAQALGRAGLALVLLLLGVLPAFAAATWLVRRPRR